MLERDYQNKILKPAIRELLPDCIIMKQDEQQLQGIPDLVIFWQDKYAVIEVKRSSKAPYRPNQLYYLQKFIDWGALAITSYPENFDQTIDLVRDYFYATK